MKLKYYLRGLGIGIFVTAFICTIAAGSPSELTDEEIMERAESLGMVRESGTLTDAGNMFLDEGETEAAEQVGTEGQTEEDQAGTEGHTEEDQAGTEGQTEEYQKGTEGQTEEDQAGTEGQTEEDQAGTEGQTKEDQAGTEGQTKEDQKGTGGQTGGQGQANAASAPSSGAEDGSPAGTDTDVQNAAGKESGNSQDANSSEKNRRSSTQNDSTGETSGQRTPAEDGEVTIVVSKGDDSYRISQRLEALGMVENARAFDTYLCEKGYDNKIAIGSHTIKKGLSEEEIAEALVGK